MKTWRSVLLVLLICLGLVLPVQGADAAFTGLPAGFEPLLLDEGMLNPAQVIEDELLLALPPFPVKPGAEAEPKTWDGERWTSAQPDAAEQRKDNPFAILRDLKKHQR